MRSSIVVVLWLALVGWACSPAGSSESLAAEPVTLEFRVAVEPESEGAEAFSHKGSELWLGPATVFAVETARAAQDGSGSPVVQLELVDGDRFYDWTGTLVGERMAIVIDGQVLKAPTVSAALMGALRVGGVTSGWTPEDAERIAAGLVVGSR